MEQTFNKLVRDKIPEIIENNNEIAITKTLNDKEYLNALKTKLLEEYNEVILSSGKDFLEELADMLEVIDALASTENKTLNDIINIKEEKKQNRGGFDKKILLIKTMTK